MVYCCFPTSDLFLPVFHIAQLRKVFYYGEDYHQQYLAKPGPSWVWCLEWKEVDSQGSGMTQTPHDKEGQHMSKLKIPGSDSVRCSALLLSAATAGWGIGPVSRYYSDSFQPMQLILGCQKELGRPRWTKYCSTEWPFASGLWTIPSTENQRSPRIWNLLTDTLRFGEVSLPPFESWCPRGLESHAPKLPEAMGCPRGR